MCCVVVCDLGTSRIGAPYIYDISNLRVKLLVHHVNGRPWKVKALLLSDVDNGDGCRLCEAGTDLLYIALVLRLLNVFLHVRCYFHQNFILFAAILNSSRANIYSKVSDLSKLFWNFVLETYIHCVFVLSVFYILFLVYLTTI
jgi:hypothetical protein